MASPLRTGLIVGLCISGSLILSIQAKTDQKPNASQGSCMDTTIEMKGVFNTEIPCDAACASAASEAALALNKLRKGGLLPCNGPMNFCAREQQNSQISTCEQCGTKTRICICEFNLFHPLALAATETFVLDGITSTCGEESRIQSLESYNAAGFVAYSINQEAGGPKRSCAVPEDTRCDCNSGGDAPNGCMFSS